jgi:hypothetical protein
MSAMAVATAEEPEEAGLREEDRRILWEQFVEVYAHSQKSYDDAVRALAAAGVALTVSLATALHHFATSGLVAVIFFLVSLGLNLASFGTAQADMKTRIACLRARKTDGIEGNRLDDGDHRAQRRGWRGRADGKRPTRCLHCSCDMRR